MFSNLPLSASQLLLASLGTTMSVHHQSRIPKDADAVVVISNHRSFMDALVLMDALQRPIHIACHYYMSQAPLLREMIQLLGCIPLPQKGQGAKKFFRQARKLLEEQEWVGIFPEGGEPMIDLTEPQEVSSFERGFAHLALGTSMANVAILPVAIVSVKESVHYTFPIKLLHWFDSSEPLFNRPGLQPVVIYHQVKVAIGHPYWITKEKQQKYPGKGAKIAVNQLTESCRTQIVQLLHSH